MDITPINLKEKFSLIDHYWDPKIVGELNGQHVKIAKFKDEFIFHEHEEEDEMFLVIEGTLLMDLADKTITIEEGEFIIIPRGTDHKPKAVGEAKVLLFEPADTLNTGNRENELTKRGIERI